MRKSSASARGNTRREPPHADHSHAESAQPRSRRKQHRRRSTMNKEWPIWEVFVRSKQGLDHKHCGSLHAADASMALRMARDVYTRRQEGVSIWVVPSSAITASAPDEKAELFEPAADKIYRHPTFFTLPDEVNHM
jgi:ring-1,2-phenylacetyl-CoA epoxidase subunit PaaB